MNFAMRALLVLLLVAGSEPSRANDEEQPTDPAAPAPAAPTRWVVPGQVAPPDRAYGWRQLAYDARFLVRRPGALDRRDRWTLLGVAGATLLLYAWRDEIREEVLDTRSDSRTDLLDGARTMGKGAFAPALALGAWAASLATRDPRERETAQMLLESAGFSAVAALGGSFVLAAERPEDGDSITLFDADGHGVSLDAALAASVIPPLRCQYLRLRPGDGRGRRALKRTATALLYTGAALTALQRLDQDKHWAPDAFLGLVAGLGVGRTICESHEEAREKRRRVGLRATPGGAAVVWSFGGRRAASVSP